MTNKKGAIKPMLAKEYKADGIDFPLLVSPKIDGIRGLRYENSLMSRSWKLIPNRYIQRVVSQHIPAGLDFEITSGDSYSSSTSAVMTHEGEPDFTLWIFDYFLEPSMPYEARMKKVVELLSTVDFHSLRFEIRVVDSVLVHNKSELKAYQQKCLDEGFEGVMLRKPGSSYKYGRSTLKQGYLLKLKTFEDSEAYVVDFIEGLKNENELEEDELGYAKRSSSQDNMVPANTLGSLVVHDPKFNWTFRIGGGEGLTHELRKHIWTNREAFRGAIVKYRYMPYGMVDLPRLPGFLGFRSPLDMS